jgi:hypothetical protein
MRFDSVKQREFLTFFERGARDSERWCSLRTEEAAANQQKQIPALPKCTEAWRGLLQVPVQACHRGTLESLEIPMQCVDARAPIILYI